jgi:hypothetical protein
MNNHLKIIIYRLESLGYTPTHVFRAKDEIYTITTKERPNTKIFLSLKHSVTIESKTITWQIYINPIDEVSGKSVLSTNLPKSLKEPFKYLFPKIGNR